MKTVDCCIIGGGSAAITCATSAASYGVKDILMIERDECLGGILNQCIHNGFGLQIFKKECTGPEFAELLVSELERYHIEVKCNTTVTKISEDKIVTYINDKEGLVQVQAKTIVLASGCLERSRGAISIPGDRCSHILTAGSAQRYLNIDGYLCGKKVFILGSGDIGLIMARRMTLEGATVVGVAEIMPYSNGLSRNIVQCLEDFDIPLYLSTTVTKTIGNPTLERIELSRVDEHGVVIPNSQWEEEVDCLLLSVGLIPEISLIEHLPIEKDSKTKSVKVNECNETTLPGFFACGNALQVHDLVDYVALEGEITGKHIANYLTGAIIEETPKKVEAKDGISYVVPQYLRLSNIESGTKFFYRVKKPMKNCILTISSQGKVLKEVKKRVVLPAEMETIYLEETMLNQIEETLEFEMREVL